MSGSSFNNRKSTRCTLSSLKAESDTRAETQINTPTRITITHQVQLKPETSHTQFQNKRPEWF